MYSYEDSNDREKCLGSLLLFTRVFYRLRTGREFKLTHPVGRESHILSVCRELTSVLHGDTEKLIINIPPRYGKTELVIHFIAWSLARYPDSNYMYVSYGVNLAKKQTQTVRDIINLPHYRKLFNVRVDPETSAKDFFKTMQGGSVYAAGADGTITGSGAGIQGVERFGGSIIIDDIHKPVDVTSDTVRSHTNHWYRNTLQSRKNSASTPIIFIGQRLHEDDLAQNLINTNDWKTLIIPALDENNNALHPDLHSTKDLLQMKETMPYEYAAQYQQNPQPAGGGIFKSEWFHLLEYEPKILSTFITADTAETAKNYNDASVFSFWGFYKITQANIETDMYGLHWIDCVEIRVEPKDLQDEFMQFYASCMRHSVKPRMAAIEKKSTGVTLSSVLSSMQGLQILDINRTSASGSKTSRYLEAQQYIASKQISLPMISKHTNMCIEHCAKITANNTHRNDDIADTLYDAVKIALIDKIILGRISNKRDDDNIAKIITSRQRMINIARAN